MLNALKCTFPHGLVHRLRCHLPRPTFLLLHWAYFITTCIVSSIIFWHFSTPHGNVSYVDSIFLVVAAMTQAGLNTINLSALNTFQQCLLFFHIICGNQLFISALVVHVRKQAFHSKFKKAVEEKEKAEKRQRTLFEDPRSILGQPFFAVQTGIAVHPPTMGRTLYCAESKFTLLIY
jgi:hypothetical protein